MGQCHEVSKKAGLSFSFESFAAHMWYSCFDMYNIKDTATYDSLYACIDKWKSLGDMTEHRRAAAALLECKSDQETFKRMEAKKIDISKAQLRNELRSEFRHRGERAEMAM